jgi:hypothetical protein
LFHDSVTEFEDTHDPILYFNVLSFFIAFFKIYYKSGNFMYVSIFQEKNSCLLMFPSRGASSSLGVASIEAGREGNEAAASSCAGTVFTPV